MNIIFHGLIIFSVMVTAYDMTFALRFIDTMKEWELNPAAVLVYHTCGAYGIFALKTFTTCYAIVTLEMAFVLNHRKTAWLGVVIITIIHSMLMLYYIGINVNVDNLPR